MPIYKMTGQKDGKQKYRVRINYQDVSGATRQADRVAYGKTAAKELEAKLLSELKNEAPAASLTLSELLDEYLAAKEHEVRESGFELKASTLTRYFVTDENKNLKLSKLTPQFMQRWKNEIDRMTYLRKGKAYPLSLKTKQNIYGSVRAMLNYAVRLGYMSKNPLTVVGNFRSATEPKKQMDYYTADEFKLFIATARKFAENSAKLIDWDYLYLFRDCFLHRRKERRNIRIKVVGHNRR